MTTIAILKLMKYLGITVFSAGLYGAYTAQTTRQRSASAHWLASFGLILIWAAGYGVMKQMGYSLRTIWIVVPLFSSLVSYGTALASVGETRFRPWFGAIGVSGLVIAMIAMVFRTQPHDILLITLVPVLFVGVLFGLKPIATQQENDEEEAKQITLHWFTWLARLEGISLLVLLGIYMPLKYSKIIVLDGGQGWFGWVHGILQLLYLAGLVVVSLQCRWSWGQRILGFVASVVPFGPFLFERKLLNK